VSANCVKQGNASQVPLTFGNVPCRVQSPFHFGNGVADAYYPHLTRAPAPK